MKAVDPTIKVGGPAFERPDIKANVTGFIDGTYEHLDFVSGHGYACGSTKTPDSEVYDKVDRLVGHMKNIADYCKTKTDRHIPVYWDEMNISWTWRSWDARMKTNKGACFDALGYRASIMKGIDGVFPWNECDGIYGKMGNKFKLRPPAHCIHLLATYIKGQWVDTQDAPMVKILGVINDSNRVILMVNRSGDTHSMALSFTGWISEPSGDTPVAHYRIDASGKSQSSVTNATLKKGLGLAPHTVHLLVLNESVERPPNQGTAAKLYFKSGFESDVILKDFRRFQDKDMSTGYNWNRLGSAIPGVSEFNIKYWGGQCPNDAYVDIINDPDGFRGQVLHAQVNSDSGDRTRCRTEGSLYFDKPIDQLCIRYQYKISDAYQAVLDDNVRGWWLISEMWTEGPNTDRASQPIYLYRGNDHFYFTATLRERKKEGRGYNTLWKVENPDYKIPLGKWVEVVHYIKPGPAGEGRLYFKFDGHVVFDIKGKPIAWNNRRWRYWSCLKLYEDVTITDFLRKRGTPAQVWYDDFEVWSGIPNELKLY